jgi:valyl-tRNA synthetase
MMKALPQHYDAAETESRWQKHWEEKKTYQWDDSATREESFVIDTPPPTVSGHLHMGHIFSYTQADFVARWQRMNGKSVFYPMGFDDNGLPTERLVEKERKIQAHKYIQEHGREGFIALCNEVSEQARQDFRKLFQSTALSVDWRQEYHTISPEVQRISQLSFLDLHAKNAVERRLEPMLWDTVDQTAIAQAEVVDVEMASHFSDIRFRVENEPSLSGRGQGEGWYSYSPKELVARAQELRENQTDAEALVWYYLRDRRLGHKFRRQHPMDHYILDFYCHELKLAIELDGSQHLEEEGQIADRKRTQYLNEKGIKVLRFFNNDMLKNTEAVLTLILAETSPHPNPLPEGEGVITIATTRPELIPACVAVFYHPEDTRYQHLKGKFAITPLFGVRVPILEDDTVEMEKGTGIMMCCTFGDEKDIEKWRKYDLPTRVILNKYGKIDFTSLFELSDTGIVTGVIAFVGGNRLQYEGNSWHKSNLEQNNTVDISLCINNLGLLKDLRVTQARTKILELLTESGDLIESKPITHAVKCAERSGAPLEILPSPQWFVKVLDIKEQLKAKSQACNWHPEWMQVRMEQWIDGLNWDWCISRQRYFGVPFPVWGMVYWEEDNLGEDNLHLEVMITRKNEISLFANVSELPVNPMSTLPRGFTKIREIYSGWEAIEDSTGKRVHIIGNTDVMDTWATSSLTPQIIQDAGMRNLELAKGGVVSKSQLLNPKSLLFPADLRPQAHEIIRTWAFYTLVKAHYHADSIPWKNLMISGWCLAEDKTKMSKSKGNVVTPQDLITEYSADVVRYWASTSRLGQDTAFSRDSLKIGKKLVNKLWNATKFAAIHLDKLPQVQGEITATLDRWILTRLHRTVDKAEKEFKRYEYAAARVAIEDFFWNDFCDNYLELVKKRVYDEAGDSPEGQQSAVQTIALCLDAILRLFAPILPHVTEELWSHIFPEKFAKTQSIHARDNWPQKTDYLVDVEAETAGRDVLELLEMLRKAKSERGVSIKYPIASLTITPRDATLATLPDDIQLDLIGAGNVQAIHWKENGQENPSAGAITSDSGNYQVALVFAEQSDAA